jgi:Na+/proline symporter
LDINDTIILAATAIIVAIYSAFGGIRAVTFTDALRFITFGVMLPGIALIMWGNISSINQILDIFLNNPTFNYEGLLPRIDNNISGFINTFVFIAIPWLTPAIFQRIAVAKNIRQIKNSFFISSIICAFVNVIISWIAILMVANNPNIGSQNILPHISLWPRNI